MRPGNIKIKTMPPVKMASRMNRVNKGGLQIEASLATPVG
jgi:hypothetical protein